MDSTLTRPARTHVVRQRPVPGLAAASVATGMALLTSWLLPSVGAPTTAIALGVVAVNAGLIRPRMRAGLDAVSRQALRTAVVLLGSQLSLPQLREIGGTGLAIVASTVTVTFAGTRLVARAFGVRRPLGLLVATGFSICGASAIAAMRPVAGGDDDEAAVAVALVTVCGSLAIVVLPLLRTPLGLDYSAFGAWAGASVHDVGQTVATANRVGHGALGPAVVVKLTRVVLLAPLVATVTFVRRREHLDGGRRGWPVPLFVLGFLAAVALRSTAVLPVAVLDGARELQQVLLTAALFGVGSGISWPVLRRAGGRPLLLGLVSWVLVAAVSYLGVRLTA
jgi:uncharacterized integral membrane protein (TIGR00698 family)